MEKTIQASFDQHGILLARCRAELVSAIVAAGAEICRALQAGNKLLLCGNGGSAADSQHIAAELIGRYKKERAPLSAIALTTDTSILTCVGNDYSYEDIFSRQVLGLARPGDVFIGISTSGNSANVVKAAQAAREVGCRTVGLLGNGGGRLASLCDHPLVIPSSDTPRIQEMHILIGHMLCDFLEDGQDGEA